MARATSPLTTWSPVMLSVLRIMAALLFGAHGTSKFFDWPVAFQGGTPETFTLIWFAGAIEIVCGTLLVIGLFSRPAAFLASGMCAAAYFIGHGSRDFWPLANGGDAAILFCFVFLYVVFAGPGSIAVDAWFNRRRPLRV